MVAMTFPPMKRGARPNYDKYPPEVRRLALSAVAGGASILETAKHFGIPYSSLYRWIAAARDPQNAKGPENRA